MTEDEMRAEIERLRKEFVDRGMSHVAYPDLVHRAETIQPRDLFPYGMGH